LAVTRLVIWACADSSIIRSIALSVGVRVIPFESHLLVLNQTHDLRHSHVRRARYRGEIYVERRNCSVKN